MWLFLWKNTIKNVSLFRNFAENGTGCWDAGAYSVCSMQEGTTQCTYTHTSACACAFFCVVPQDIRFCHILRLRSAELLHSLQYL
jgi:hypothetical protein